MTGLISAYEALLDGPLRPDPAQRQVIEHLEALRLAMMERPAGLRRFLGSNETPKGIYVWGDVGRGKSMLVDLLVENLGEIPARRAHFHAFMRELHRELHKARGRNEDTPIQAATDAVADGLCLLALDEVEVTDIADAMIVGRVFERLHERNVTIVATSNRPPDGLYADGLKRDLFLPCVRFMEATMTLIELDGGKDHRRSLDTHREVCFGQDTTEFDDMWSALEPPETVHEILGVRISVRRKGAAIRSTFDGLCRVALAASHYLDLAAIADTLFLEDVPRLGPNDDDAARRFIMLIDAIYDGKCNLVISAAADPDALYHGETFETEFRRTASRLLEMQRPNWSENLSPR